MVCLTQQLGDGRPVAHLRGRLNRRVPQDADLRAMHRVLDEDRAEVAIEDADGSLVTAQVTFAGDHPVPTELLAPDAGDELAAGIDP